MLLTALAAPGLQPLGLQPLLPASLAFVLVMSSRWSAWETLRDHVASQEGPVWGYRGVGTLLGTEKPGDPLLSPSCAARPDVGPPGARQSWESSHLKSERTGPGANSNSSSRTTAEGPASTWGRALRAWRWRRGRLAQVETRLQQHPRCHGEGWRGERNGKNGL